MLDSDDSRRLRAAHHEAAHAVFAVAERFTLGHAFLTRATTNDGSLGGCTQWWAKDSAPPGGKARVLYAGQYAERHLAMVDPTVRVPAHDENWNNDDDVAAAVLAPLFQSTPNADSLVRRETARLVRRYWRAIVSVARTLCEPNHDQAPAPQKCADGAHIPESRVIQAGEVRRYFGEDRIAEGAFVSSEAREFAPGWEVDDWLAAQKKVGVDYPEIVDDWIADDNAGNDTILALFKFGSAVDAHQAHGTLAPFADMGLGVQVAGDLLTATLASESLGAIAIQRVQRFGGEYVRQRCAVSFRE